MAAQDADGTTQTTVDKSRFDGLMGNYQKALGMLTPEQRAALKAPAAGQAGAQDQGGNAAGDSQHNAGSEPGRVNDPTEYEDGAVYAYRDGQFVLTDPPVPFQHSEFVSRGAKREPTLSELRAESDRQAGKPSLSHSWPDITAR
jgi:hypothetical protein